MKLILIAAIMASAVAIPTATHAQTKNVLIMRQTIAPPKSPASPKPDSGSYTLVSGQWSACSGGEKTRTNTCLSSAGNSVDASLCNAPPIEQQACTYVCNTTPVKKLFKLPPSYGPQTYTNASNPSQALAYCQSQTADYPYARCWFNDDVDRVYLMGLSTPPEYDDSRTFSYSGQSANFACTAN